jgi:phage portal protein BeeE
LKIAQWNNWTTDKAVKDGYKASGWVYRAVSLISRNIASVDWVVVDSNGERVPTHPVYKVLQRPCKAFDKQDFFELISAWQQLSGEAYIKKVYDSRGLISELWPIK